MAGTVAGGLIGDPGLGGVTREQYAVDVLHGIGAPITPSNVAAIEIWIVHESGNSRSGFAFNPLNSTDHPFGSAGQGGSQGNIQRYANYQQGVQTIVHQLQYPRYGYPAIVAALKSNAGTAAVFRAINASSWGTHNWTSAELGGNAAGAPITSTTPGAGGSPSGSGFTAQPAFFGGSLISGAGSLAGGLINLGGAAAGGLGGFFLGGGGDSSGVTGKGSKAIAGAAGGLTSGVTAAVEAIGAMGAAVVEIIVNWKYELEVLIGAAMVLLGVRLVIADSTGGHVVPKPSSGTAGTVAAAAVAA